uniref:Uncharacterized protein n=1 Tax=Lutzomyia longipalpis TaxID=7200 RepID=A0A1B0GHE7_LUTLO
MNVNGPTEVAVSAAAGRTSRPSASGQPFGVQQPAGQQPPAQPPQATLQQIPVENGVDFRHSAVSAVTITSHQPPSSSNVSMNVNGPTEVAVSAAAGRTSRPSASGQPFGVQQPAGQQPPAQPPQATLQQIPVENGVDFRHSAVSAVTITPHQPPSGSNVRHSPVTQPFVAQAAVGGRQSASSSSDPSSRSRLGGPTAGASVFQAQQTTSSYQKLALLQQQQQAHTIRRDDGQVKPS